MLDINNITKTFGADGKNVKALDAVSLDMSGGELVAVNGPSGCGKTTLLLTAGGLLEPDGGRVSIDGVDLYSTSREKRAEKRAVNIGFVFQQFYLIPYLNVIENAMVSAIGKKNVRERALNLIRRFNLESRIEHKPSELSTGERQRTALVRALINGPKLLFADEPTGNLDDKNAEEVMEALSCFASEGGGVLLVSHDQRTSMHSSRSYFMDKGKLVLVKE